MATNTQTGEAQTDTHTPDFSIIEKIGYGTLDAFGSTLKRFSRYDYAAGEVVNLSEGTYIIEKIESPRGRYPELNGGIAHLQRIAGKGVMSRRMTESVLHTRTGRKEIDLTGESE